jgi:hypothetical protein
LTFVWYIYIHICIHIHFYVYVYAYILLCQTSVRSFECPCAMRAASSRRFREESVPSNGHQTWLGNFLKIGILILLMGKSSLMRKKHKIIMIAISSSDIGSAGNGSRGSAPYFQGGLIQKVEFCSTCACASFISLHKVERHNVYIRLSTFSSMLLYINVLLNCTWPVLQSKLALVAQLVRWYILRKNKHKLPRAKEEKL